MPTIETVKTCHEKAATMTCSVATVKSTQQSTSFGLVKKATKHQKRVSTGMTVMATVMKVIAMVMTVTATIMTVAATIMTVTGMAWMAHISSLVLEDTN
eukprot:7495723-Ditylum_brightwellii.AAC.1